MIEEWKPVVGYEGFYEVSNYGRVKSFCKNKTTGKIMTPSIRKGYHGVMLYSNGERPITNARVHRLVIESFIGASPMDVDHINGVTGDNRINNLAYVTVRENNTRTANRLGRSLPVGVYGHGKGYVARIKFKRKNIRIGYFKNVTDAEQAYKLKLLDFFDIDLLSTRKS